MVETARSSTTLRKPASQRPHCMDPAFRSARPLACRSEQMVLKAVRGRRGGDTSKILIRLLASGVVVTLATVASAQAPHNTKAKTKDAGTKTGPAAGAAIAGKFAPSCTQPTFPSASPFGIDQQCPVVGSGGAEADQNRGTNNFCATAEPQPIKIADMKALQTSVQANKRINFGNPRTHPSHPTAGPTKDRTPLAALGEGTLRVLDGFVFIARQEGNESVDCGPNVLDDPLFHDIHMSIVADESDTHGDECEAVVVEMSPHHRPAPWTAQGVQKLAAKHKRVQVKGKLFFDSSHSTRQDGKEVPGDPRRVSLCEIHPIYAFNVCDVAPCTSAASWIPLDKWLHDNS